MPPGGEPEPLVRHALVEYAVWRIWSFVFCLFIVLFVFCSSADLVCMSVHMCIVHRSVVSSLFYEHEYDWVIWVMMSSLVNIFLPYEIECDVLFAPS